MTHSEIINWLLKGDVAIQYQVYRDLLGRHRKDLQKRIAREGWGKRFLSLQNKNGHWGQKFYQPKWTSTHYTILDLKNLQIDPYNSKVRKTIDMLLNEEKGVDGGINPSKDIKESDVCLNGMFLNFAAYFKTNEQKLISIIDFILRQVLPDGGFNCNFNRFGAKHSSLHSTLSVLEGFLEYRNTHYNYRLDEIQKIEAAAREFILKHQLFISDRTGEIIKTVFLKLSYPARWHYDILRALDYFQSAGTPYNKRMQPAIEILKRKRKKNNLWPLQAHHPGKFHFHMEKTGQDSRWNTLRALRVLNHFDNN